MVAAAASKLTDSWIIEIYKGRLLFGGLCCSLGVNWRSIDFCPTLFAHPYFYFFHSSNGRPVGTSRDFLTLTIPRYYRSFFFPIFI